MKEPDRTKAKRIHEIVMATAPELTPRTWYGMPAYAKDDKVICWFQDAAKFKSRYATFSFSDKAHLDEGRMWPVVYSILELTPAEEARIAALVKKAVS
ncbi:MAG: iron chaperone [Nitrososphaerales archaeon]